MNNIQPQKIVSAPFKCTFDQINYKVSVDNVPGAEGQLIKNFVKPDGKWNGRYVINKFVEHTARHNVIRALFFSILDAFLRWKLFSKNPEKNKNYCEYMQYRTYQSQKKMAEAANENNIRAKFNRKNKKIKTEIENKSTEPQRRDLLKIELKRRLDSDVVLDNLRRAAKERKDKFVKEMTNQTKWNSDEILKKELDLIDENTQDVHRVDGLLENYNVELLNVTKGHKSVITALPAVKQALQETMEACQKEKDTSRARKKATLTNEFYSKRIKFVDEFKEYLNDKGELVKLSKYVNLAKKDEKEDFKILNDERSLKEIKLEILEDFNKILEDNHFLDIVPEPVPAVKVGGNEAPGKIAPVQDPKPKVQGVKEPKIAAAPKTLEDGKRKNEAKPLEEVLPEEKKAPDQAKKEDVAEINPEPNEQKKEAAKEVIQEQKPPESPKIEQKKPEPGFMERWFSPKKDPKPEPQPVNEPKVEEQPKQVINDVPKALASLSEDQITRVKRLLPDLVDDARFDIVLGYLILKDDRNKEIDLLKKFRDLIKKDYKDIDNFYSILIYFCQPTEKYLESIQNASLEKLKEEEKKLTDYSINYFLKGLSAKKWNDDAIKDLSLVSNALIVKNFEVGKLIEAKQPKPKAKK